jgi:hypothetical protein
VTVVVVVVFCFEVEYEAHTQRHVVVMF